MTTKSCPNCRHACYLMAPACEKCGWDFLESKLPPLRDYRLRSPYPFFGTKKKIASDMWRLFGDVKRYIEPFLGSAPMLLARPKDRRIQCVVSDASRYISNFWRSVQQKPDEVATWCDWPINEGDLHARHAWLEDQPFEETIAGTPDGDDLLERLHSLETGLQQDPLWCDPIIAAWWAWGCSAWIGPEWCNGRRKRRKSDCATEKAVHRRCRQVEVNGCGGVLAQQIPLTHEGGVCRKRSEAKCFKGVSATRSRHGRTALALRARSNALQRYFRRLQAELRDVIVCCVDWTRVVTPCVLGDRGVAGVFLDPPYKQFGKCYGRYHDEMISARVRAWAINHAHDERLRIILCEYESAFDMPDDWSVYRWDHDKGMSNSNRNAGRERVWCSPGIKPLDRLERLVRVK